MMTVAEAREKRVCRICEKPIDLSGGPKDAPMEFARCVWPAKLTFNFGSEFAHTDCLPPNQQTMAHPGGGFGD